ncbi:MAG: carbohydrate binding family 9 domain-containing protein, partial [Woeseia sp.]|nr:carbohydrate binding family 9 domain-containing protein [Woeseia sp.]
MGRAFCCLIVYLAFAIRVLAQDLPTASAGVEIIVDDTAAAAITLQRIDRADSDIVIDGHVDEALWSEQAVLGDYRVIEPDTLAVPTYPTELRVLYTDRGLYVAAVMKQPEHTLVRRHAPRDSFDVNRDTVALNVDSSGSGRYGYWFTLALGDGQMDGTVLPERQYSRDWDGAWYGATQQTATGWSAEFFIPWSQMAMPKEDGIRRINLYTSRKVAHLNERYGWPALPRSQPRFMSLWQPLQLGGVNPRQQWSLFPYVSTTFNRVGHNRSKAGLDLFWRPSTNFQATATLNPDFGSVESDDVDVNLTSQETFFPEKRLFFLEGQDVFSTTSRADGGGPNRFSLINTRRIGGRPGAPGLPSGVSLSRRDSLQPADLEAAAKATGQIGRIRYGVLGAIEDDTDFTADDGNVYTQSGRDFGALRMIYEDSINATYRGIGFASTVVNRESSDTVVHAADFKYLSERGQWNIEG